MKIKDAWSFLARYSNKGDLRQFWQAFPEVGTGSYGEMLSNYHRLLHEAVYTVVKAQKPPLPQVRCTRCTHWNRERGETPCCRLGICGECKEYTSKKAAQARVADNNRKEGKNDPKETEGGSRCRRASTTT